MFKKISIVNAIILVIILGIDIWNNCLWQNLYYSSSSLEYFFWNTEKLFSMLLIPAAFLGELALMIKNRKQLGNKIIFGAALLILDFAIGFYTLALVAARF